MKRLMERKECEIEFMYCDGDCRCYSVFRWVQTYNGWECSSCGYRTYSVPA